MKVFIVYAHPEPLSFNGAMFRKAQQEFIAKGHEIRISDLYKMRFNPISDASNFVSLKNPDFFKQQLEEINASNLGTFSSDISAEQEKIEWCDLMIWQFPLWWFSVPAILKGWVDRVFAMDKAYGNGKIYENGLLRGRKALLSLTTGGPQDAYLENGIQGDINGILRPLQRGILEFTGFTVLNPFVVYGPARLGQEDRLIELNRWAVRLSRLESETPIIVGRY